MQVFLTGGTGYIGAAVLDALIKSGHHVTALVRDPEKAARLEARGATPVMGELAGPARYLKQATAAEAVVHTAFESSPRGPASDKAFLDAVLPAIAATGAPRVFLFTSGIWVLGPAPEAVDEGAALAPIPLGERGVADGALPEGVFRVLVEQPPVGVTEAEDLGAVGEDLDLAPRIEHDADMRPGHRGSRMAPVGLRARHVEHRGGSGGPGPAVDVHDVEQAPGAVHEEHRAQSIGQAVEALDGGERARGCARA